MGVIVTDRWAYPLLYCAEALPLAAIQHGTPLPGHWRECETFEIPTGVVTWVYDLTMAHVARLVVNYEIGSPATNSAVTTHDWEWLGEWPAPADACEAVEAKYDAFWTAIATVLYNGTRISGYRWSWWKDDWSGTDPSFRYATRNVQVGSGSAMNPPQVSMAVTEETEIRRRWGRFYLPFIASSQMSTGRFTSGMCDTVANAAATLLGTIEDEWRHVTVSSKEPRLLETQYVRVDDTPDTMRSRRWPSSTYRKRNAVT